MPLSLSAQEKLYDAHVHLSEGRTSYEEYRKQLDSTGQAVTRFGGILMAEKGKPEKTRRDNDALIDLAKVHPEIVPICSVHPSDGEAALKELKRLKERGVKIIKLHPHTQNFDVQSEEAVKLCKTAGELGLFILMDNANIKPGDSENLFDLAVKCSRTRFVFAHLGGLNFRFWNIIPIARTAKGFYSDNIYFDISATITLLAGSPLEEEFIWTIRNIGTDRILLGSDFPQYTLKQAASALEKMKLTPEEKARIRYRNAEKLFSL
ncbi:MAG: amidohydrolase family protein [Mucilaginibacter polytrichastri]|nr:amidohydrolase family protein [Mucilaginibacter polytrichastri]